MPTESRDDLQVRQRFGARLREVRKAQGLTQQDLVEQMGYKDRSYISEYESGERRLYAHELADYAKALGVPITELFEGLGDAGASTDIEAIVVEWLRRLPEPEQLLVLELLTRIVPVFAEHEPSAPTVSDLLKAYRREDPTGRGAAHELIDDVLNEGKPDGPDRNKTDR